MSSPAKIQVEFEAIKNQEINRLFDEFKNKANELGTAVINAGGKINQAFTGIESTLTRTDQGITRTAAIFQRLGESGTSGIGNFEHSVLQLNQATIQSEGGLARMGRAVLQNATSFGVFSASVFGTIASISNLQRAGVLVEQQLLRQQRANTTLAQAELTLQQARDNGNVSAERIAVLEARVVDARARVTIETSKTEIAQGDYNETIGAFVTQIIPQMVAAGGAGVQFFTNMSKAIKDNNISFGSIVTSIKNFINPVQQIAPAIHRAGDGLNFFTEQGRKANQVSGGLTKSLGLTRGAMIGLAATGAVIGGFAIALVVDAENTRLKIEELQRAIARLPPGSEEAFRKTADISSAFLGSMQGQIKSFLTTDILGGGTTEGIGLTRLLFGPGNIIDEFFDDMRAEVQGEKVKEKANTLGAEFMKIVVEQGFDKMPATVAGKVQVAQKELLALLTPRGFKVSTTDPKTGEFSQAYAKTYIDAIQEGLGIIEKAIPEIEARLHEILVGGTIAERTDVLGLPDATTRNNTLAELKGHFTNATILMTDYFNQLETDSRLTWDAYIATVKNASEEDINIAKTMVDERQKSGDEVNEIVETMGAKIAQSTNQWVMEAKKQGATEQELLPILRQRAEAMGLVGDVTYFSATQLANWIDAENGVLDTTANTVEMLDILNGVLEQIPEKTEAWNTAIDEQQKKFDNINKAFGVYIDNLNLTDDQLETLNSLAEEHNNKIADEERSLVSLADSFGLVNEQMLEYLLSDEDNRISINETIAAHGNYARALNETELNLRLISEGHRDAVVNIDDFLQGVVRSGAEAERTNLLLTDVANTMGVILPRGMELTNEQLQEIITSQEQLGSGAEVVSRILQDSLAPSFAIVLESAQKLAEGGKDAKKGANEILSGLDISKDLKGKMKDIRDDLAEDLDNIDQVIDTWNAVRVIDWEGKLSSKEFETEVQNIISNLEDLNDPEGVAFASQLEKAFEGTKDMSAEARQEFEQRLDPVMQELFGEGGRFADGEISVSDLRYALELLDKVVNPLVTSFENLANVKVPENLDNNSAAVELALTGDDGGEGPMVIAAPDTTQFDEAMKNVEAAIARVDAARPIVDILADHRQFVKAGNEVLKAVEQIDKLAPIVDLMADHRQFVKAGNEVLKAVKQIDALRPIVDFMGDHSNSGNFMDVAEEVEDRADELDGRVVTITFKAKQEGDFSPGNQTGGVQILTKDTFVRAGEGNRPEIHAFFPLDRGSLARTARPFKLDLPKVEVPNWSPSIKMDEMVASQPMNVMSALSNIRLPQFLNANITVDLGPVLGKITQRATINLGSHNLVG